MITFVAYDQVFLELSWKWLHDPEIKELTMTPDFTKEDQQLWFETISNRIDYKIWGIVCNAHPIGVCGIKNITLSDGEYWGYIGDKNFWGIGIGSFMLKFILLEAKKMTLKSVWLTVSINNERALKLYEKYGFEKEETNSSLLKLRYKFNIHD
jgi:RimJ/RimL family protein N-acetyltransferase